jgi:O-antigen chain-terminating methyltransferase
MINKHLADFSVERLVERMRVGARRQMRSAGPLTTENGGADGRGAETSAQIPSQLAELQRDPLVLQASFSPHPDDRYHVNDLLRYSDRNFIQNAYLAILKRGPDATGYKSFIEGLRSGRLNKLDVLARLRYSAEGRAKKVRIDGLFFPAAVRLSYQTPVVGYLLKLAVGLVRLPKSIRHTQQFEAHVLAQQEQIADHANRGNAALVALANEVSGGLVRLQESILRMGGDQQEQLTSLTRQQEEQVASLARQQEEQAASLGRQRQEIASLASEQLQNLEALRDKQRQQVASIDLRHGQLEASFEQHRQSLESFAAEQQERVALLAAKHREDLEALGRNQEQRTESLAAEQQQRLAGFVTELQQDLARTHAQLEHFQRLIDSQRQDIEAGKNQFRKENIAVEQRRGKDHSEREKKLELLAKELRMELARVFAKQQEIRSELVLQAQRTNMLLEKAADQVSRPQGKEYLQVMAREADHTLDAFYVALEEQFRGGRDEIKDRLRIYLPLIVKAGIGTVDQPILDVGSGRGEWLELLREQGLVASGIDSNRMQVAKSLELDLDVTEADLLTYLREQPDASLGAVTGFHIVEHLAVETLVAFLDETVRVVKPGGAVIFETPNPENILVGSCNFYFDPTHRNPLPGPVLKFLVESRGFKDVQILKLNPSDESPVKGGTELAKRFNQYFYGPMDYAVIGWRS